MTGVRGFLALWVVLFHANAGSPPGKSMGSFVAHGWMGVDAFFLLSGFVLSLVYASRAPQSFSFSWYRNYLVRRIAKIYPIHLLTLCASIVLVVTAAHFHYHFVSKVEDTAWTAICQLLLLHAFGLNQGLSWNAASWSVSAEWFAYTVLFAPIIFHLRRAKTASVAALAVCAWSGLLALCHFVLHTNIALNTAGILRITPEFLCGYLLYRLLHERASRFGDLWTLLGLALLVYVCAGIAHTQRLLMPALMAVSTGLYFGGRLTNAVFANRFALALGEASYSTYMTHAFVFMLWNQLMRRSSLLSGHISPGVSAALVSALACGCGYLTFRFVEDPLRMSLLARFGAGQRMPKASPAGLSSSTVPPREPNAAPPC